MKQATDSHKKHELPKGLPRWIASCGPTTQKALLTTLVGLGIMSASHAQDVVARFPSTNNLEQGQIREHTVTGVGGMINITGDGGDGISNFKIEIYDNNNVLKETLQWGGNIFGMRETADKLKYYAMNGNGNSCDNGGKDTFGADDRNDSYYNGDNHCVKLPAIMPVSLIEFSARCIKNNEKNNVLLSWTSASETNNAGFHIQKSNDAIHWSNLVFIPGAGTSRTENHYQYTDQEAYPGISYYRLMQEDEDGSIQIYSEIVTASCATASPHFTLYPNPTTASQATLSLPEGQHIISIDNAQGQKLAASQISSTGSYSLSELFGNISLSEGIYYLSDSTGFITKLVIIK